MKKLLVLAGVCALALNLSARDDVHHFSIEEALSSPKAKGVLDPNIKLSFGSGTKGGIIKSGLTANKKQMPLTKATKRRASGRFYRR